jgi:hypothetical protein
MPIPPLDARGLLPPGLHVADLESIPPIFCANGHRWRLWDAALDGLDLLCPRATGAPGVRPSLVLAGSFFSDKAMPEDVEATLVFPANTPASVCWNWTLQLPALHAMLKRDYALDFYPSLPGNNDFSLFFQYVGPKTAQAKGLAEKDPRGAIQCLNW